MTNSKSSKRALFSSVVALLLCFTMLLGTTFAWFTDSAASGSNVITAGNLDIVVEYTLDGETWKNLDGATDLFKKGLWEPGHTEVVALRIKNNGSLALKYAANMNIVSEDVGKTKDNKDIILSEILTVSTLIQQAVEADGTANSAGDIALGLAFNSENSVAYENTTTFKAGNVLGNDKELQPGAAHYLIVKVDMAETVGNEANHNGTNVPKINFGINVLATQFTYENDSFGNQYDANAKYDVDIWDGNTVTAPVADAEGVYHISTAAELIGMMNDSKYPNCNKYQNVVLENNIDLSGRTISGFGDESGFFDGIFDGQGYTISNFKIDASDRTYYAGLFNQVAQYSGENTVIKNLTVTDATVVGPGQVGVIAGGMNGNTVVDNCKVIDCTVVGVKKVGSVVGYTAGGTVTNNYAENCDVLYSEKEGGEILGYENTGSTVSNNSVNNVSVNQGVAVSSADELVALGGTKINGYYVLTADIDMAGKAMKSMELSGGAIVNFNGNGHTISNLNLGAANIHGMTGAGNEVAGLFDLSAPATTVSLTVSDLTVKNAAVSCSGYAAAIVGYNSNKNTVISLNDVDVDGAAITAESVAALVAYSTGKVNLNDCDVKGLTLIGEEGRPEKVGAYIGTANTADCVVTVTNCTNDTTYNDYGRIIYGATYN